MKMSDENQLWPEEAKSDLQKHRPEEGQRVPIGGREHLFAELQGKGKE